MTADDPTGPSTDLSVPDAIDHPLPFEGLVAPEAVDATPPTGARVLAMGSILLGGLLGGLIGFGIGDALGSTGTETVQGTDGSENWSAIGALIGAVFGAGGVGVVASLTLRAMNEWNAVTHPEDDDPNRRGHL